MALAQSDEEKARADLQALKTEIARINQEIGSASKRRDLLQTQLRDAEVEQARIARDIGRAQRASADQRAELKTLQAEKTRLERARDDQKSRIAVELRTAWQMGQQGQIKVLLNQESPDTVARVMTYYRYFFRARNELLTAFRDTLVELQHTEQRIATTLRELQEREQRLAEQQKKLVAAQDKRKLAVTQLNESIRGKGEQLKQMQADQAELQKLLDAIREAVVNLQVPENVQPFKAARGKMPWPVPGRASARFGNPRNQGKMRWQGVTIPADAGTPVKAIHHGRVVYADWLRGMGLLLIIDHGEGYMSLYAHNQSLLRDVGEWVTAETPISTVGDSGGQSRPALYFEVREKGKPVNPSRWCRR
ncbi:murein hydrolase activator EnvC family protein [Pseudohalioglobus lutimaris]|nr:peptidoglycan DD-metalloendopeptidase family protein [Pseudohalioglobus lutimaris]